LKSAKEEIERLKEENRRLANENAVISNKIPTINWSWQREKLS